jgi:activator of HSP90 ATPase
MFPFPCCGKSADRSTIRFVEALLDTPENSLMALVPSTRRRWITAAAIALGSLAIASRDSLAASDNGLSHSAEAIHQETVFKASPQRIYDALLDARQFQQVELLSGAMKDTDLNAKPAMISREPGGAFSIFGDYIVGRQLELVPNQRIVQAWREISWDPGVYSVVRFQLIPQGSETKLVFDHTGFPVGNGEHLAIGWKAHYWEPLKKFLA